MHESSCFITLTYSDEHLPADQSLHVSDWQNFAKRLRKKRGSFRFYHCGEYGETTWRPHYHALIWGLDFRSDQKVYKVTDNGDTLYTSAALDKIWGKGFCPIGEVTFQSAAYVARYILKKKLGEFAIDEYWRPGLERVSYRTGEVFDFLLPPYTTMSRRPGIGAKWFKQFHTDVYPDDFCVVNGKKTRPPAYYDYQLELTNPELHSTIKRQRALSGLKHSDNNTPERLAVREEILLSKLKQLPRSQA